MVAAAAPSPPTAPRGAWATTAALKPEPIGASPMSRSGASTTGSFEVGGATARVSAPCGRARGARARVVVGDRARDVLDRRRRVRRDDDVDGRAGLATESELELHALPSGCDGHGEAAAAEHDPGAGRHGRAHAGVERSRRRRRERAPRCRSSRSGRRPSSPPSSTPNAACVFEMRMLSSTRGTSWRGVPRRAPAPGSRPSRPRPDAGSRVPSSKHEDRGGRGVRAERCGSRDGGGRRRQRDRRRRRRRRRRRERRRHPCRRPPTGTDETTPELERADGMNRSLAGRTVAGERRQRGRLDAPRAPRIARRACRSARASNGSRPCLHVDRVAARRSGRASCARGARGPRPTRRRARAGPDERAARAGRPTARARAARRARSPAGPNRATCTERMPKLALPSVTPVRPCSTSCTSAEDHEEAPGSTATSTSGSASVAGGIAAASPPAPAIAASEHGDADRRPGARARPRRARRARRPPRVDRRAPGRGRAPRRTRGRAVRRRRGPGSARRRRRIVTLTSLLGWKGPAATQSDRARTVDGEGSPSPTQQRSRRAEARSRPRATPSLRTRCGCGPAASSRS